MRAIGPTYQRHLFLRERGEIGRQKSSTVPVDRQALFETAPLKVLSEVAQGFAAIIRDEDYVASDPVFKAISGNWSIGSCHFRQK